MARGCCAIGSGWKSVLDLDNCDIRLGGLQSEKITFLSCMGLVLLEGESTSQFPFTI